MNLVLIGYRGAGKSSVARELAPRLGWEWVDADVEVERQAGRSIAAIFAEVGEASFRQLESQVLAELLRRQRIVLAAGGGAVLRAENRELLAAAGKVVWLKAEAATIFRRVTADDTTAARRPNLTPRGGEQEIVELLAQRMPLYRQCANLEIETEGKTPAELADEILDRLDLTELRRERS
jgi:shikimate kinase